MAMPRSTIRTTAATLVQLAQRSSHTFGRCGRPQQRGIATRQTRHQLNTGASIPAIGFGTFQDPDAQEDAVSLVRRSSSAQSCGCNNYHPDDVEKALDESLVDIYTPYVDLLMMHYPCTFARGEDRFPRDSNGKMILGQTTFVDTWKAMEKLIKTGKVKAIGVSNFSKGELETLIQESETVPAVHQMEVHTYPQQKSFNQWLRSKGIHVIQFSPLGSMNDFYRSTGRSKEISYMMRVVDQPLLKELGRKYGKSAVQIVLAWGANNGRSVIPKSTIDWQIQENVEADFELEAEDIKAIETLDIKARFNDLSLDYQWRLYSDLDGIEGTVEGRRH
ncbi:hypothetical protein INS49_013602 [Diaporthe citri]|uniref:uncharacterized protein n=1 Tax=Diaporthe citri TaxID=83186 RepID=UPI001C7FEFA5|nr:uncharacterized protein INS49_013602 [Diaporthe citri]KAG6357723.1 hypothetical protein INS49_013602 [Diaporthe citri]